MRKLLIAIVVFAAAPPVSGNELELPPGRWWEDQRLVERIALSTEQQQQIRGLVYERAREMIGLKADVDRAGLDLADSVNSHHFDEQAVRAAFAAFQTARGKLENERFEMVLEVRQVLTDEQWQKLQELKRRVQQMRQQRRPGEGPMTERPRGPGL